MFFHIPIKLPSLANMRMHWRKMASLKKQQRAATQLWMANSGALGALRTLAKLRAGKLSAPLLITITRIAPRRLDDDNLVSACKYIRDQIAAAIGADDGSDQYTWWYKQEKGEYGVSVEITLR